jgi:hypothetical protein
MSFLSPIWLWAAAAIAVPTLIHLLARGQGKAIALGTVRFLPQTRSHRLRHIRPTGLLRYLLRAALLAALAVALAAPRWWHEEAAASARWALVDPALVSERERLEPASPDLYAALDAVPEDERRWLAPGLPLGSRGIATDSPVDLWSLLSEAGGTLPGNATLEVFVVDRAATLKGARPALSQQVTWWSLAEPQENRWIQRVVPSGEDLAITVGTSDAGGTTFASIELPASGSPELEIQPEAGGDPRVVGLTDGGVLVSDDRAEIPSGAGPLTVGLRADDLRSGDASAFRRATAAVAEHLGRPLVFAPEAGSDAPIDLQIRLGEPAGQTTSTARVSLTDGEGGSLCRQAIWLPTLPDPYLQLRRCGTPTDGDEVWLDGWGNALLTRSERPDGTDFQWQGRFSTSDSNLTESGLPHLLLGLIEPNDASANGVANAASDRRQAPSGHAQPRSSDKPRPGHPDPLPERLAWGLVALLFFLDRLLVRRLA